MFTRNINKKILKRRIFSVLCSYCCADKRYLNGRIYLCTEKKIIKKKVNVATEIYDSNSKILEEKKTLNRFIRNREKKLKKNSRQKINVGRLMNV